MLDAVDDGQSTVRLPLTYIARLEPPIGRDALRVQLGMLEVSAMVSATLPSGEHKDAGIKTYPANTLGPLIQISP